MISWFQNQVYLSLKVYLSKSGNHELSGYTFWRIHSFMIKSNTLWQGSVVSSWIGKFGFHEVGDDAIGSRISLTQLQGFWAFFEKDLAFGEEFLHLQWDQFFPPQPVKWIISYYYPPDGFSGKTFGKRHSQIFKRKDPFISRWCGWILEWMFLFLGNSIGCSRKKDPTRRGQIPNSTSFS